MDYIQLLGLPEIFFAHTFGALKYKNQLDPFQNKIEIGYVAEGIASFRQENETITAEKYDVYCNLFQQKNFIECNSFHEHHCTAFFVPFIFVEKEADALSLPRHLPLSKYEKIHELIDEIIRLNTIHPERKITLSGLFLQLLDEYSAHSKTNMSKEYSSSAIYVSKAKQYVYENLYRPITQKEIAEHLGITPEYLCAIFKKTNDVPLMHFINEVKLAKVCALIQHENLKLREAAELFGYSDPNYVSRLIKKYYNKNVIDYKKKEDSDLEILD